MFLEYGDDSVAQSGDASTWPVSRRRTSSRRSSSGAGSWPTWNKSTRYVAYDSRLTSGRYRYYRDPEVLDSQLGARYVGDMDRMFEAYGEASAVDVVPGADETIPERLPVTAISSSTGNR